MSSHYEESIALLEGTASPTGHEKEPFSTIRANPSSALTRWVTVLLCTFVLLDVAVYTYIARLLVLEDVNPNTLKIKSSYINLDELYDPQWGIVNSSHHNPIVNLPRVAASVARSDPHRTPPLDQHRPLTPYGVMELPDRHLQLHPDINTIYQFRVIDWGMERCQLALKLPALNETLIEPFNFHGDDEMVMVDVCELETSHMLDLWTLSWSNRPTCRKHVGTLAARPDQEVVLPEFPCELASIRSFEISCAAQQHDCEIDIWSSQDRNWGLFMYQHQTI